MDKGRSGSGDGVDCVCVGETMVAFVADGTSTRYRAVTAGAESNVAVAMAGLGCHVRWVSRLGDDPLGDFVVDTISAAGVRVDAVREESHPTGTLTKHVTDEGTRVQYYRSESAARRLSPDDLPRIGTPTWVHVTGITPALSTSAAQLIEAVLSRPHGGRVSFDVNHRPALWPDVETARAVLVPMARRADVTFIGDDEAERLIGTATLDAVADAFLVRDDQEVVFKRGGGPVTVISSAGEVSERALAVPVVDLVGAGDAFAAGYLAGEIFGWRTRDRIRLGHLLGSRVIGVTADTVPPLSADDLANLSPDWLDSVWRSGT